MCVPRCPLRRAVVMTLLINAPLAAPALTLLGLDKVRQEQLAMRGEVRAAARPRVCGFLDSRL